MVSRRALVLGSVVFVVMAAAAGCSDQYEGRMEITGGVTLKGEPLPKGSIAFEPLDGQGTLSGAPVTNGEYKIPRPNGLKPGKYVVRITAGDGKTPVNEEEAGGPGGSTNIVSWDLIPADWNTKSKQQVEVKASGPNKFDFDIPTISTPPRRRR
jgi:hypothetical protein